MGKSFDFSGWATRNDVKCTDGRTIRKNAFIDDDGITVPLVWQHQHNDPANVLGHALLENRAEGVYTYGWFNDSEGGKNAKLLVDHGDVKALSIYANKLQQRGGDVFHGAIREVSLVLAGANPGAFIDTVEISHGDDDGEGAIIYTGEDINVDNSEYSNSEETIEHSDEKNENSEETEGKDAKMAEEKKTDDKTIQDVVDSMSEEQKNVMYFLIGEALKNAEKNEETVKHSDEGGEEEMKHNVFDAEEATNTLSHDAMAEMITDARRYGSLRDSVLAHTGEYGITDIDFLFPDAKNYTSSPEFIKRRDAWVSAVMGGTHHTPFSRVKSTFANITADEARAKGYTKGNQKVDEVIALLKRSTTPTTIYKKQKLDRDDVLDITDFDVVSWLKGEMRIMLDEEIARAILVGDGRTASSDDKISETNIRPIATDDQLYTIQATYSAGATDDETSANIIRSLITAQLNYEGSGNKTLFITDAALLNILLMKDTTGRDIYKDESEVAKKLRVNRIETVPSAVMGSVTAIIVDLKDYNVGADKGGQVSMFDDFDIDYNQQKYLIETRCSGALVKPYSAIALTAAAAEG